eukprot:m.237149 g.237149  ORF g.237149 m.237149 type:complete len:459 (+) comp19364_c0_seq2:52-1428(+)
MMSTMAGSRNLCSARKLYLPGLSANISSQCSCIVVFMLSCCGVLVSSLPRECMYSNKHYSEGNDLAIATSAIGASSVILCCLVIMIVISYRKEQHFMRERVILGLMVSNCTYSISSVVPAWYLKPGTCSYLVTLQGDAVLRGMWFMGSYWMACYEIMIVGMAIPLLIRGTPAVTWRTEKVLHAICFLCGVVALTLWAVFGVPVVEKQRQSWEQARSCFESLDSKNSSTGTDYTPCYDIVIGPFNHYSMQYDKLVALFARVWISPMILSIILFVVSRYYYHRFLQDWHEEAAQTKERWSRDLWAASDEPARNVQWRLLELRREAAAEIVRPLEPYVTAFALFTIPAIIVATPWCVDVSTRGRHYCQLPCEMVLAMRSGATALIYFYDNDNRRQLCQGRKLWALFTHRLCSCMYATQTVDLDGEAIPSRYAGTKNMLKRVDFTNKLSVRLLETSFSDVGA